MTHRSAAFAPSVDTARHRQTSKPHALPKVNAALKQQKFPLCISGLSLSLYSQIHCRYTPLPRWFTSSDLNAVISEPSLVGRSSPVFSFLFFFPFTFFRSSSHDQCFGYREAFSFFFLYLVSALYSILAYSHSPILHKKKNTFLAAAMDPRSHQSRPPSTSLPQGSTPLSSTPISSMPMPQYTTMQPQYPVSQPQTLPPLQPHPSQSPAPHSYMSQPPYRPDLSRFTASSTHDVYAPSTAPMMPHTTVGSLPPSSFLSHPNPQAQQPQPHQPYPPPHSVLPPASGAQSYPQPIAPAPPRDRRTEYSGVPSGAFSYSDGKTASPWMNPDPVAGANGGGSPYTPKDAPRTQVVGSQGRRGILPSVPGRTTPVTNGVNGSAKNTTIPAKDAEGKFPCPHCNKTYLHAKHLKRHLLRRKSPAFLPDLQYSKFLKLMLALIKRHR